MKRTIFFALLVFLSVPAFAQDGDRTLNLRIDPIDVSDGKDNLALDFEISNKSTLGAYVAESVGEAAGRYIVGLRYNRYLSGEALDNSWVLGFGANYLGEDPRVNENDARKTGNYQGIVGLGHQWYWDTLNVHLGGAYSYIEPTSEFTQGSGGFEPIFEATVGLAF